MFFFSIFPSKLEMSFVCCFLGPSFLETFLFFENFNEDFFYRFIGSFFQNRLPVSEKTIGIDYTHGV